MWPVRRIERMPRRGTSWSYHPHGLVLDTMDRGPLVTATFGPFRSGSAYQSPRDQFLPRPAHRKVWRQLCCSTQLSLLHLSSQWASHNLWSSDHAHSSSAWYSSARWYVLRVVPLRYFRANTLSGGHTSPVQTCDGSSYPKRLHLL